MAILLEYYERANGDILLPPDHASFLEFLPPGCVRCEATDLRQIDRIQGRLEQQERIRLEQDGQREEAALAERRAEIRSSLTTRMTSAATTQYERDFLAAYLKLSDQRKRDHYQKRFTCDMAYFEMREFDRPRTPDERTHNWHADASEACAPLKAVTNG